MAFMGTESAFSYSATHGWKYDVFLSFRGTDSRTNFTNHLYAALKQKGIFVFRDDEELERGTIISPELMKIIEESRSAVVILSSDYASSSWCLTELAKIIECMKKMRLIVLPVFYDVDPSDVRNQRGTFAEAFANHEERTQDNILDTWRAALTEVANLSGFHLQDQHESKVIEEIVGKISGNLTFTYSIVDKDLVGINSRMEELVNLLGMGLNDVRFIGIWGMGGIGKTTLARVVYERFHDDFDDSSFLANVREESGKHGGLVSLQKQLLSDVLFQRSTDFQNVQWGINMIQERFCHKRVLVILDDVDLRVQLEALVGEKSWFGHGSRIIITTRDQHLLIKAQIYELKELNNDESLKLFSRKAFKKDYPSKGYEELSQEVIRYAQGLPLALKVLGYFLIGRDQYLWEIALRRFKEYPSRNILDVLQISFDGLEERMKKIFLDIAFFFKEEDKSHVKNILQTLYDRPSIDIDVLLEKSLITISSGCFQMQGLLQELGKEIVRRESPKEPGGRSRLWFYNDIVHVLKNNTGTEQVEGIVLETPLPENEDLDAKAFSKMEILRILKISNGRFPQGLTYLPNELRLLNWDGYPLESMPTGFQPNNLVQLIMRHSRIKQLWRGVVSLNGLKLIDLDSSQNLTEIPDLSGAPNLEGLSLEYCSGLSKIDPSFRNHKCLIQVHMKGCKNLESLSDYISLESLEIFDLSGCSRLKKFPKIVGNMSHLSILNLENSGIQDLSVEHLTGLITLDLGDCKNLSSLSEASCSLPSLKFLHLDGCSKLDKLPENLGNLEGLKMLSVSRTAIKGLPPSIVRLKYLDELSLKRCGLSPKQSNLLLSTLSALPSITKLNLSYCNIRAIPDVFGCFPSLSLLNLSGNNFVCLPKSIILLSNLESLDLSCCTDLQLLPELPLNIRSIDVNGCTSLETLPIRPEDDFHPSLHLLKCIKLIENQGYGSDIFLTMLRHYFQTPDPWDINVYIPGSEIPKWFRHQSVGDSMEFLEEGPSDFMGIAVCAVFVRHQHHPSKISGFRLIWQYNFIGCTRGNKGHDFAGESVEIDSYNLWLKYFPFWKNGKLSPIHTNGLSRITVECETYEAGIEVTMCGARLVDKKAIEDLKQSMTGCSVIPYNGRCVITPYEDDLDDSAKDTKIQQSRDDYVGDELAGFNGEASTSKSNEVDLPHPKSILFPNLIERLVLCFGIGVGIGLGIYLHKDKVTQIVRKRNRNPSESGSFH